MTRATRTRIVRMNDFDAATFYMIQVRQLDELAELASQSNDLFERAAEFRNQARALRNKASDILAEPYGVLGYHRTGEEPLFADAATAFGKLESYYRDKACEAFGREPYTSPRAAIERFFGSNRLARYDRGEFDD